MSAVEVIEQIKALPIEEERQVAEFVRTLDTSTRPEAERVIRYADDEPVKAAGDRIAGRYPETFRKLAA